MRAAVYASAPVIALASMAVSAQSSSTLADVLRRAAEYLIDYQQELGTIIAEEQYLQEVYSENTTVAPAQRFGAPPVTRIARRQLVSDFLMLRLPNSAEVWTGFRDVFEVDGHRVREHRDRFAQLLEAEREHAITGWRRLANESARFNVGTVDSHFNVPTFALRPLLPDEQPRFRFMKRGEETIEGQRLWVVAFREVDGPSLFVDAMNYAALTSGRVWLFPANGRIVRTELVVAGPNDAEARYEVRYRVDDRLGTWVPVELRERHADGRSTIRVVAQYSNFRRFEVGVRLIVPQSR